MPEYYGTPAGYAAYHAARDNTVPARDALELEADLLVASEWIDARFRASFGGLKLSGRDQIREWERTSAYDIHGNLISGVPREIEHATYEAAAIHGAAPGSLSVNFTPGKYKSASVEGAVSVEFASFASASDVQTDFARINEILTPILTGTGAGSSLSGTSMR